MSETPPGPWRKPEPGPPPPPPYGQPGGPAYGQQPYAFGAPDHPQATTVLILGILGLVVCGLLAPFAWVMGNRVVREIDASQGAVGGRSSANTGRICGIVGSAIIGLGLLAVIGFVLFFLVLGTAAVTTSP